MSTPARATGAGGRRDEPVTVDADTVAAAVRVLPQVASLAAGDAVPVATYLPGRKVIGVSIRDTSVTVAVVGAQGVTVTSIASAVRSAVAPVVGARRIDVHVADVVVPGEKRDAAPDEPDAAIGAG